MNQQSQLNVSCREDWSAFQAEMRREYPEIWEGLSGEDWNLCWLAFWRGHTRGCEHALERLRGPIDGLKNLAGP